MKNTQPVQQITDERRVRYVGVEVGEGCLSRLLSLFRMDVQDPSALLPELAGRPVYLAMAMNEKSQLRLKPQNLPVNLPPAQRA